MIITCACGARLKISDDKLTPAGVKIKCPKCATVHLARKQGSPAQEPARSPQVPAPAPAAAREPSMPWFAAGAPAAPPDGPLVLIAHDSSVVAEMIAVALRDAGMRSDYAPNGLEALKKATELRPQAMVVDVGLTGIYGFELCERLKSDSGTKAIKIILLSSVYGLTAYKRAPVTLYGADDYIEKHHIPDQLVPKLKRLLSGEQPLAPEQPSPAPAEALEQQEAQPKPTAPLVSRKGVIQQPAAPAAPAAPQAAAAPPAPAVPVPSEPPAPPSRRPQPPPAPAAPAPRGFELPEIPSILPKTPVTLDMGRDREAPAPVRPEPAAPKTPAPSPVLPTPAVEMSAPPRQPSHEDGSIKLDSGFFEHDEYDAPPAAGPIAAADPAEIEKARRFARIIVSDIALYNQEAANEGIRNGTFYDLLKDDISEGRSLYDGRVPAAIRATKDYLQEAFDEFIAAKKKLR